MDYDPINWYQRPRSTLGEVQCAPVDPSLPPPWKEVIDVATGRFYYWNTATNVTQFDKPAYQTPCRSFYPFPSPEPVTSVPPSSALFEPPPQPPHISPPSFPTSHQTQPPALPVPVVHDLLNQIAAIQQTIADFSNTRQEAVRKFQEHRRQFQELRSQWPYRTATPTVTSSAYSVHSNPQPSSTYDDHDVNLPFTRPYPNPQHHFHNPESHLENTPNPSHPPPISDDLEPPTVPFSGDVVAEVGLSSPIPKSDDDVVDGGTTTAVAFSSAPELDRELVGLNTVPQVLQFDTHIAIDVVRLLPNTVDATAKPDQVPMHALVYNNTPDSPKNHHSPPSIGGAYSMSLCPVLTPLSSECLASVVVSFAGSLSPAVLESVVLKNAIAKETYRLSTVNLGWSYAKHLELYAMLRSFLSKWLFGDKYGKGDDGVILGFTSDVGNAPVASALSTSSTAAFRCIYKVTSKHRELALNGLWDDSGGLPTLKLTLKSLCKPVVVLEDGVPIHSDDEMFGDHQQSVIVPGSPQLLLVVGHFSLVWILNSRLKAIWLCRTFLESIASHLFGIDGLRLKSSIGCIIAGDIEQATVQFATATDDIEHFDSVLSPLWEHTTTQIGLPLMLKLLFLNVPDTQVVAICLSALAEILSSAINGSQAISQESDDLVSKIVIHSLLNRTREFKEWAQCPVVESVASFLTSSLKVPILITIVTEESAAVIVSDSVRRARATVVVISEAGKVDTIASCEIQLVGDVFQFQQSYSRYVTVESNPIFYDHGVVELERLWRGVDSLAYVTSNLLAIESPVSAVIQVVTAAGFQPIIFTLAVIPCLRKIKCTDAVFGAFHQLHQLRMSPAERLCGYLLSMQKTPFDCVALNITCVHVILDIELRNPAILSTPLFGITSLRQSQALQGLLVEVVHRSIINIMYANALVILVIQHANLSLTSNSELSSLRYPSAPLLSREYGVILMTDMHKYFYNMVKHVHKAKLFLELCSSIFYSPFHELVRKFFPLSDTAAIHFLRPILDNILRGDGHYGIGIMVFHSILLLVSLNCKHQGFAITYDEVDIGNQCPPVSSSIYLPDHTLWLIEFGCVKIDFGNLARLPHKLFPVPMLSNATLLLILLSTILHSHIPECVNFCHLLRGPNREALRIPLHHSYGWQSPFNASVSVHLSAFLHTWTIWTDDDGIALSSALTITKGLNNSELELNNIESEAATATTMLSFSAMVRLLGAGNKVHAASCKAAIDTKMYISRTLIGMCPQYTLSPSSPDMEVTQHEMLPTQVPYAVIFSYCATLATLLTLLKVILAKLLEMELDGGFAHKMEKMCLLIAGQEGKADMRSPSVPLLSADDLYQFVTVIDFFDMVLPAPFSKLLSAADLIMIARQGRRMVSRHSAEILPFWNFLSVKALRTCLILRGEEC